MSLLVIPSANAFELEPLPTNATNRGGVCNTWGNTACSSASLAPNNQNCGLCAMTQCVFMKMISLGTWLIVLSNTSNAHSHAAMTYSFLMKAFITTSRPSKYFVSSWGHGVIRTLPERRAMEVLAISCCSKMAT